MLDDTYITFQYLLKTESVPNPGEFSLVIHVLVHI